MFLNRCCCNGLGWLWAFGSVSTAVCAAVGMRYGSVVWPGGCAVVRMRKRTIVRMGCCSTVRMGCGAVVRAGRGAVVGVGRSAGGDSTGAGGTRCVSGRNGGVCAGIATRQGSQDAAGSN